MNDPTPIRPSGSLLERAAQIYDFNQALRARAPFDDEPDPFAPPREPAPADPAKPGTAHARAVERPPVASTIVDLADIEQRLRHDDWIDRKPAAEPAAPPPPKRPMRISPVDRTALREAGFILPDAAVSALAEEFRIVKRQLLLAASGNGADPLDRGRRILVASGQPNEGKTFCAVNLALSIAQEKDIEVLLIDADFAKPEILSTLGLEGGPGIMDAIADPGVDVEDCIIATDIPNLLVLPAGRQTNEATELLASERTRVIFERLSADPARILVLDSPPVLAASPASVLALHVGQIVLVVRADQTSESELRDAIGLLGGCESLQLLLNGVQYAPGGRRFGAYYGYGE